MSRTFFSPTETRPYSSQQQNQGYISRFVNNNTGCTTTNDGMVITSFGEQIKNLNKLMENLATTNENVRMKKSMFDAAMARLLCYWNIETDSNRVLLFRLMVSFFKYIKIFLDPKWLTPLLDKIESKESEKKFTKENRDEIVNIAERLRSEMGKKKKKVNVSGNAEFWDLKIRTNAKNYCVCKQWAIEYFEKTMISMEKIRFVDPFTLMRIKDPVRGKNCAHLQPFDLATYLGRWLRAGGDSLWLCPVCEGQTHPRSLYVDAYVAKLMSDYPTKDEILLNDKCEIVTEKTGAQTVVVSIESDDEADNPPRLASQPPTSPRRAAISPAATAKPAMSASLPASFVAASELLPLPPPKGQLKFPSLPFHAPAPTGPNGHPQPLPAPHPPSHQIHPSGLYRPLTSAEIAQTSPPSRPPQTRNPASLPPTPGSWRTAGGFRLPTPKSFAEGGPAPPPNPPHLTDPKYRTRNSRSKVLKCKNRSLAEEDDESDILNDYMRFRYSPPHHFRGGPPAGRHRGEEAPPHRQLPASRLSLRDGDEVIVISDQEDSDESEMASSRDGQLDERRGDDGDAFSFASTRLESLAPAKKRLKRKFATETCATSEA